LQSKIQSGLKTVFAKWNRLKATFNVIHLKFNDTATGEQKYREAVQKTMLDMQESIRQADSRIQLMHAAIGHDFKASKEETISLWEVITGVKKELTKVTADAASDSEFLAQTRNNLPSLSVNLEKLLKHYRTNMPRINTGLSQFKARLVRLEQSQQQNAPSGFDDFDLGGNGTLNQGLELEEVKVTLERSITEVKTTVAATAAAAPSRGNKDNFGLGQAEANEVVEQRLSYLEAWTSGEGFSSGGHVFNSKAAV
jgi:hypothetical protein